MKRFFNREQYTYLLFVILSLIGIWFLTKLWVPAGFTVAGHDSGLAVNASNFFKSRLYAWDVQGFGRDNSGYFGSLIMHFVDFVSSKVAGVAFAGNQINIFFWISAIFVSAAIFSRSLKQRAGNYFAFFFPVFVTFNFYILQSIFIFERAKYSLLVAALLFLAIYIKMRTKELSVLISGILCSFVFFIFNGGSWLGLPLYGGLLVLGFSILVFEIVFIVKDRKINNFLNLLIFYVVIGVGFVLFNAYSLLPYTSKFLNQDYAAVTDKSVVSAGEGWLNNLSQASSYLNLFRLQGVPDWYAGELKPNPDHAYASLYLNNRLLVVASFAFPLLIMVAFFLSKNKEQKELLILFGISLFFGAFFVAGSHPPLGFLYTFMYEHVPGFSIFRSPYYKFGSEFFIAVAFLISFSLSSLIEKNIGKLNKRHFYGFIFGMVIVLLWFRFYNIIFKPSLVFTWHSGLSTRVQVPSYVDNFGGWFDKQETGDSRTLLLPPLNNSWKNDAYNWGYWSLTNLPSVVSNKSFVSNGELGDGESVWVNKLYSLIESSDEIGVFNLSKKLGIDYILLRNDVLTDSSWSAARSPKTYSDILGGFRSLTKIEVFGQWSVFKFNREASPMFYTTNGLVSLNGNYPYLSQAFYSNENSVGGVNINSYSGYVSEVVNEYSCKSCPLENKDALTSLPPVSILPNSPFYVLKERTENRALNSATTNRSKVDAYLGSVLRRGSEIKAMWDFGLNTDYAVSSLQKMNIYLKKTYEIYSTEDSDQYFEAKRLIDNLNVVERSFKAIASNYDFGTKKQDYRQGILDIIWNINKLKTLFPIIEDKNKQEMEKVYTVPGNGGIIRNLYIDENTIPLGLDGRPVLPTKITFTSDKNASDVKMEKASGSLIKLLMPKNYSDGKILMEFPKFPNLLVRTGYSVEQTPTGPRSCTLGSLVRFNPNRKYRIEVTATKPWQVLKLYLKDGEINNGDSGFIQGQDETEINATLLSRPFYHVYDPSNGAKNLKIYLCSSNITPPEFENFEIHEIVSPDIVAVDEMPEVSRNYPQIKYVKIDPTHYRVDIENAKNPFILIFNQSFNSSWAIDLQNSDHFTINGYANAWKISKTGTYSIDLVYKPQSEFKKGVVVSLFGIFAFAVLATVLIVFEKKLKNGHN